MSRGRGPTARCGHGASPFSLPLVAEVLLFTSYRGHDAGFHWSTHFLVGLAAAALWNLGWLFVAAVPARAQVLSVLAFHLFAMFPDLLFRGGIPHDGWMNLFFGHVAVRYVPGGDDTWLVLALAVSGLYAAALSAWLRARRAEAKAGMAPGIGIGGGAVLRPQRDPHSTLLAHVIGGPRRPPDVLLLHGLAASGQVWADVAPRLAGRGHGVLIPDLLGFGRSRRIGSVFDLDNQADALERLLDHHGVHSALVVGHSWGCAVAVHLAKRAPERVRRLVLVSPPVFRDAQEARTRLSQRGWLARKVLEGSPVARFTCALMCLVRAPLARIAPRLVGDLPPEVVRDSFEHSWPSYRAALASLFLENPLPRALRDPPEPTTVVVGDQDRETPAKDVLDHPHDAVAVEVVDGDHLLPLRRSAEVEVIIAFSAGE